MDDSGLSDNRDLNRVVVSQRSRWARLTTGVAAAYGLSSAGLVLGALVAVGADILEVPDVLFRPVWAAATAVLVVAAGMTVRELAREHATTSVACATILFAAALTAILDAIESVGVNRNEVVLIGVTSIAFGGLLLLGVHLQRRREQPVSPAA